MEPSQDTYRELGQSIKRYRKGAGRTQAQLAVEIGISRASLANIEAGRQQVLVHYIYAIAEALDLDSPMALMPTTPQDQSSRNLDIEASAVPLPDKGLSEKQRQEVRHLMGGVLNNRRDGNVREEG